MTRWVTVLGLLATAGCPPADVRVAMFRPMDEALAVAEANRARVTTGLKATGSARGHFTDDRGKRRHFDLEAKLQVVPESHMRFVMQSVLGGDELEVGMNHEKWWLWSQRPEEQYVERPLDDREAIIGGGIPLRPEQLMESLGLSRLESVGAVQRVVDDYQQVLIVAPSDGAGGVIEKEYWLDRYAPWLVRRIVFRDVDGRAVLSSALGGYQPVGDEGLYLPYEIRLCWSLDDSEMLFRVRRWQELESLTREHRAFVSPRDRRR